MNDNPFIYTPQKSLKNRLKTVSQGLIYAVVFTIVLYFIFLIPSQVDGPSMMPTLHDDELLFASKLATWFYSNEDLTNKLGLDYKRGDIIIFDTQSSVLVKRIIAKGGDTIKFNAGKVYVNGSELIEEYIPSHFVTNLPPEALSLLHENTELTIPPGFYFVMGDNRSNSKDSRFDEIGLIPKEKIKGVIFFRFWPPDKILYISRGVYKEK